MAAATTGHSQANKMKSLLLHGGYSFHGTGDMLGGQGGIAYEAQLKDWLSIRYQADATIHGRSAMGYVRNDQIYQSEPLYWVTAGVQASAIPVIHILGAQTSLLNLGAGPLLRYQINSRPDSFGYSNNAGTIRPDYYTVGSITPKAVYLGYMVVLESQFIHAPQWTLGVRAHFQNDTNGDVITGISLVWRRKLIAAAQTTGVN